MLRTVHVTECSGASVDDPERGRRIVATIVGKVIAFKYRDKCRC